MANDHWAQRWADRNTPWHRPEVHPDLISRAGELLGDSRRRVLVPLCGKTLDVSWLAAQGHHVIGVELIETGIRELCKEQGIDAAVADEGAFRTYRAPDIDLYVGDLFDLSPDIIGDVDCIWDRGSMVALPPDQRGAYTAALRELSGPDTRMLLSAVSYDSSVMTGPPWPVPREDVEHCYAGCAIEILRQQDVIAESPRWQELGHESWVLSLYSISW